MKRAFFLGLSLCLFSSSISSAEVAEYKEASTYLSDIADLGNINPSHPDTKYYMISGSADIPVDPNAKPLPGNEFIKKDESSYQSDGRNVTVPVDVFKKIAAAGGEILLGKTLTAVLDIKKAFDENILQGKSALSDLVNEYFGADPSKTEPVLNDVLKGDEENPSNCPPSVKINYVNPTVANMIPNDWENQIQSFTCHYGPLYVNPGSVNARVDLGLAFISGKTYHQHRNVKWETSAAPETFPPAGVPDTLPFEDVPGLSEKIADAAAIDPDVSDELDELIENNSDLWGISNSGGPLSSPNNDISEYPAGRGITGQDVNQWAQGQSAIAQQSLVDTLQGLVDANPGDAGLAAELSKAQADQEQQAADDVKDSFDAIGTGDSFEVPYTVEQFDIPGRFSSFLNNVKSTGLFSFSSSYFNSLPGGGSPIYTVEAGTYGTHTIDLSETMGTGLAVLKTVLLLLFGFLSIRVVILKR